MRACAALNATLLGVLLASGAFLACSGGSTPPGPTTPAADATVAAVAPTAIDVAGPTPPPSAKPKIDPMNTNDCKRVMSDITNDPPQGAVALNNAMTSKDAGATDRLESVTDVVKSKRDGFRCCFDVWAKDHAGAQGSAKMVIKLKPDGSVVSVDFQDTPNRVPDIEGCLAELAKGLTYPKSPSGKETTFRYPFDFKARH